MPLLDPLSNVKAALKSANIIPDVIPEDFMPTILFSVTWEEKEVILGSELTIEDTQETPNVQITPIAPIEGRSPTYTLAMLDPDAPSHEDRKYGPYRHWLITGLVPPTASEIIAAASAQKDLAVASPDPLSSATSRPTTTPYQPPSPGPGTGRHRYVFLLFEELSGDYEIKHDSPEFGAEKESRRSWQHMPFARQHGLTLVGANYFVLNSK